MQAGPTTRRAPRCAPTRPRCPAVPEPEEERLARVEQALQCAAARIVPAFQAQRSWPQGIRAAIEELLAVLDEDRLAGRLLIAGLLADPAGLPPHGAQSIETVVEAIDAGRRLARAPASLTRANAEGALGAVLFILHTRLAGEPEGELAPLAGELTAIVILPYVGPAAAARQIRRPSRRRPRGTLDDGDVLAKVDVRLTYRTVRMLHALAAHREGGAGLSNRQVAIVPASPTRVRSRSCSRAWPGKG